MLLTTFLNFHREVEIFILLSGEISRGRKEGGLWALFHLTPSPQRAVTSLVEFGATDWIHKASIVFPLTLVSLWKESVCA